MRISRRTTKRRAQAGYSLLMVIFMVATIIIIAAAASPNILTEGRRERETETVWRGEQYARAIGLYYKKFGKYPTKIEDLTKQTNGVRFLRQAYTDPMNKEDGTWRFIYVGPNGQLIGSLKSTSLLQNALSSSGVPGGGSSSLGANLSSAIGSALGGGAGSMGSLASGATAGTGASGAGAGGTNSGGTGTGTGSGGTGTSGAGAGQTNSASAPNPLESQPQPFEGAMIGGNIIGVASKIKQPSFLVYQGEDTYQKWEFIWNPQLQLGLPGQQSVNPAAPQGTQAPAGTNPGTTPGANPNGNTPNDPGSQGNMPAPTAPASPAQGMSTPTQ